MVNAGTAGLVIANPVVLGLHIDGGTLSNTITNFVSGPAVNGVSGAIWSGSFTMMNSGTTFFETGAGTAAQNVTEISGSISGLAGIQIGEGTVTGDKGTMIFSGSNSYTGGTTLVVGELQISTLDNISGANAALDFEGGVLGVSGTTLNNLELRWSASPLSLTAADLISRMPPIPWPSIRTWAARPV